MARAHLPDGQCADLALEPPPGSTVAAPRACAPRLGTDVFYFDSLLIAKLPEVVRQHAGGRAALVFCNSRKSTGLAAAALAKQLGSALLQARRVTRRVTRRPTTASSSSSSTCMSSTSTSSICLSHRELHLPTLQGCPPQRRQRLLEAGSRLRDAKLRELVPCGVGFHTAGLEAADRTAVEQLFAEGALAVLCSTGGLAQGVNLPAHLVVLMNTAKYAPRLQGYEEYSTIEVLQMAGRAGRPQFDASGRVVVMTRPDAEQRYTALMGGALHHASDQPSI